MSEYEPGTVALVEVGCHANRAVAIRTGVPSNMGWAYCGNHHGKSSNNWSSDASGIVTPVRPLVVIDPEDAEQVARLRELYDTQCHIYGDCCPTRDLDPLADALREFANPTPPRPAEPKGLGAVVEDSKGVRWVKVNAHRDAYRQESGNHPGRYLRYADIAAVKVLSEGVPT